MREFRKWIASIIYPEIFDHAHGMKISLEEREQDLKTAKECLKGKGKMITLDLSSPIHEQGVPQWPAAHSKNACQSQEGR